MGFVPLPKLCQGFSPGPPTITARRSGGNLVSRKKRAIFMVFGEGYFFFFVIYHYR